MKSFLLLTLFYLCCIQIGQTQQSLASKLGYDQDAKLLIIHGDDLGVAHSQNEASILAMKLGMVNSASIMMPCPWVEEVAVFARERPDADLGLHLTLTNEWYRYNWGPLASLDQVPSLVNERGFLLPNCLEFGQRAVVAEAELELRAQIEQAYRMGIRPTHFDAHMGCLLFNSAELFEVYLQLGREYKVPVMVSRLFLKAASQAFLDKITDEDVIIENVLTASPQDYESGMADFYTTTLENLDIGVTVLLIHLAYNNAEMQAVTIGQEYWGAQWRQQDFDFFTSDACRRILEEQDIQMVTWREIQEVFYRE